MKGLPGSVEKFVGSCALFALVAGVSVLASCASMRVNSKSQITDEFTSGALPRTIEEQNALIDQLTRGFSIGSRTQVTATVLTPVFVKLATEDEHKDNDQLSRSDLDHAVNRRLAAWTHDRVCLAIKTSSNDYWDKELRTQEWSGEAIFSGSSRPVPLSFSRYEGIACALGVEDPRSLIAIRLRTQFTEVEKQDEVVARELRWDEPAGPQAVVKTNANPSKSPALDLLSTDLEETKMRAVMAAIRSGKIETLKGELPADPNLYSSADQAILGTVAAGLAIQGAGCYEDMLQHVIDVGAELTETLFSTNDAYRRARAYTCPRFAKEMYKWVPAERAEIERAQSDSAER